MPPDGWPQVTRQIIILEIYLKANNEQDEPPQLLDEPSPQQGGEENICILCLVNEKNAVLMPCGHARFC